MKWGRNLTRGLNATVWKNPNTYEYAGDVTPDVKKHGINFFINDDIKMLAEIRFPDFDITECEHITNDMFNDQYANDPIEIFLDV